MTWLVTNYLRLEALFVILAIYTQLIQQRIPRAIVRRR